MDLGALCLEVVKDLVLCRSIHDCVVSLVPLEVFAMKLFNVFNREYDIQLRSRLASDFLLKACYMIAIERKLDCRKELRDL